jgi:hypothetical protein
MLCHAEVPILAADRDQVRHATGLVGDRQELVRPALQSHDVEPAKAEGKNVTIFDLAQVRTVEDQRMIGWY